MGHFRKISVGVVGLHFGAQLIDSQILGGAGSKFLELVAVSDMNPERVDRLSRLYGCQGYANLREMLGDAEIEAVILLTSPNGRAELIREIINAGKDVMTTKPFEQDSVAAESVLKEARRLGRIVYMNSPAPVMNLDFRTIREWERKYDLGKLVGGHHECWYKNVESADGSWYDDPELCPAAPILRLGIYGLNDMMQFFGEPEEVQVMQSRHFTGRPTPDMARLCVKFKDGAMIDTLDSWVQQPSRGAQSMILYYENGTVYRNPPLMPEGGGMTRLCLVTKDSLDGTPVETVELSPDQLSSFYAWEVFHTAVTTRKRPENETPDSVIVNVVRLLEAVKRAALKGGTARI